MKVILDTCVVSELSRSQENQRVRERVDQMADDDLYLSVITIGEIAKGIALLAGGTKKQKLKQWLLSLEHNYSDRILPIESETAHLWGQSTATAQKNGDIVPVCDGLIAATALRYGMAVMTRNSAHFRAAGAQVINPWEKD